MASQPGLVCVAVQATRTICDLRSRRRWASKSTMSSPPTLPGPSLAMHQAGHEVAWWQGLKIDALRAARQLWEQ